MVGASAPQSVNFGLIKTLKMEWYPQLSCLALSTRETALENKPASLLVMFLGKALNGMLPSLCGRQAAARIGLTRVVLWRLFR